MVNDHGPPRRSTVYGSRGTVEGTHGEQARSEQREEVLCLFKVRNRFVFHSRGMWTLTGVSWM